MTPGSYANGFAPRDAEPRYPQLWTGCVGAWCPSLGPTGATLHDWSGRGLLGTLSAGMAPATAWNLSAGKYELTFDGSNDSVSIGTGKFAALYTSARITFSLWVRLPSSAADVQYNPLDVEGWYGFRVVNFIPRVQFSGTFSQEVSTGITINDGAYHHLAGVYDGVDEHIYLDGIKRASRTVTLGSISGSDSTAIGSQYNGLAGWLGGIDDVRIYSRTLTAFEISLLYSGGNGRGIAYTMRERGRAMSAAGRPPSGATMTGGMYVNQCGGMVA